MARADTIRSIGKVLHAVGNLTLDRERARWQDFPVKPEEFTPDWLTGVLATRYPGIEVRSFEILDKHSGTTSRARLSIQYAPTRRVQSLSSSRPLPLYLAYFSPL
jgi:hypothetical protein